MAATQGLLGNSRVSLQRRPHLRRQGMQEDLLPFVLALLGALREVVQLSFGIAVNILIRKFVSADPVPTIIMSCPRGSGLFPFRRTSWLP